MSACFERRVRVGQHVWRKLPRKQFPVGIDDTQALEPRTCAGKPRGRELEHSGGPSQLLAAANTVGAQGTKSATNGVASRTAVLWRRIANPKLDQPGAAPTSDNGNPTLDPAREV